MNRRIASWSLAVAGALVVAHASACDLFGQIACQEDADCPDEAQFCNSNVCGKTADDGRHGRAVGEGEGEGDSACAGDGECGAGLCEDGVLQCVPGAGDDAKCAEV